MDYPIPSAAPAIYSLGTDDQSTRQVPRVPLAIPQHCPKVFLATETGPEDEQLAVGSTLLDLYGSESFNPRGKYYNHQTLLAAGFNSYANLMMVKRIVPDNAKKAFVTLYLDVLPMDVPQYERDVNGKYLLDSLGNKQTTGSPIPGFKVKWVAASTLVAGSSFHTDGSTVPGDMVDGATNSVRYPIITFEHNFKSSRGNLAAVRLWARDLNNSSAMPVKMMEKYKAYPFNLALLTKSEETATATIKTTVMGSKQVGVTFKDDVYDPISDLPMFAEEVFVDRYQSLDDPRYAKIFGEIGAVKIYKQNLATILADFMEAECTATPLSSADFPATYDADNIHLFNFVSGTDSSGAPYKTFVLAEDANAVSMTLTNQVYLKGGDSGTLTDAEYNTKIRTYMQQYSDENSPLMNIAKHVESDIYDTGFELNTKRELARFISKRKNTMVHLGTFVSSVDGLDVDEELSQGRVLQSYLQTFPESEYFGTSTVRGTVTPGDMKLQNSRYRERVSMVYERAMKRSQYMGASNGYWKSGFNYDGAPGSIITTGYDIRPSFVPKAGVMEAWDSGMVFAAQFDVSSWHFPAFKTVYNNDTSILNSDMVASAIAYINTVVSAVHRNFQGVEGKTPAELSTMYNNEIAARLKGRFDNKYIITPMAGFTSLDALRGYSITVPVKLEGGVINTVMTTYVIASRYES